MSFTDNAPNRLLPEQRHRNDGPHCHISRNSAFSNGRNTTGFEALIDKIRAEYIGELTGLFGVWGIAIGHRPRGCQLQKKKVLTEAVKTFIEPWEDRLTDQFVVN